MFYVYATIYSTIYLRPGYAIGRIASYIVYAETQDVSNERPN